METFGWFVIAAGLADVVLALFVVGPRLPDGNQRRIVTGALLSGGVMVAVVGVAMVAGVIGGAEPVGR